MEVINGLQQLVDEEPDAVPVEAIRLLLQNFEQVAVHELEDQVEPPFPFESFQHPNDRLVFEDTEHLDLSTGGLLHNLVLLRRLFELLNRNNLASLLVLGFVDDTVGTFSDYANDFMVFFTIWSS
eukprot:CAMPEP_0170489900 /NCGR_PEP_ID=MMETSP0208-20121228/8195_1 /TAXON_ID=197538 /ORGANISM="Strombidium inclinatum, Strain S3" /LENGTH=124 /DNA_ID=CAMNT_0010765051 /DNA_START=3014 /DNA_END=3384 /DNA_ORIENTATION=-